ncbi:TPA: hypothetical protein HA239_05220 [Candidatus Woesearchaeota archaeon]|nr:Branched-chain amino acid aminotransferase [archaeon GW2011_AR15]MBS3103616.1 aminotransferase class IV [Candidatus Woesearchaeota archaeon]HIH41784.1 hypothetical protein [Candidatus Woesearchaeota archaeon]
MKPDDLGYKESLIYRLDTYGNDTFVKASEYSSSFPNTPYQHVRHYATSGFEGILAVRDANNEWYILTLEENLDRMQKTMKQLFLTQPEALEASLEEKRKLFSDIPGEPVALKDAPLFLDANKDKIREAIMETLKINAEKGYLDLDAKDGLIYIRPNFYRDHKLDENGNLVPGLGVASLSHHAVLEIMVQNVPNYLASAPKSGARILVYDEELHRRVIGLPPSDTPHLGFSGMSRKAKLGANYGAGGMVKNLANLLGFDEGLLTDHDRNVLEGGGENAFMIKDNKVYTPPLTQAILPGTKRNLVIKITRALGYELIEKKIPLEDFINADAAAFSGTWTGFEPLGSVVNWNPKMESNYRPHRIFGNVSEQYSNYLQGYPLDSRLEKVLPEKAHIDFSR